MEKMYFLGFQSNNLEIDWKREIARLFDPKNETNSNFNIYFIILFSSQEGPNLFEYYILVKKKML